MRWKEGLSGRSWTDRDHKDTKWERWSVSESALNTLRTPQWFKIGCPPPPSFFLRGNTSRLTAEIFIHGAIVSGTWPDPDHSTWPNSWRCVSHTCTHNGDGWPTVLLGCLFLSMLLLGLHLKLDHKQNRQIGWCHIAACPVLSGPAHAFKHTLTPAVLESRHTFRSSPAEVWMQSATRRWDNVLLFSYIT